MSAVFPSARSPDEIRHVNVLRRPGSEPLRSRDASFASAFGLDAVLELATADAAPLAIADVANEEPPLGGLRKRLLDVMTASVTLVLLAPLIVMTALAVAIVMGRPIIFAHERVGAQGRKFRCFKFRTMVADSDEVLSRHLLADRAAAEEWRLHRKLAHDPRVPWLGAILRKSSIDELPQLINVLKGDMSCVGPRPVMVDELQRYGADAGSYLRARPGITGLWQVSGRSRTSYPERVRLDALYVEHWSLVSDLVILARTVPSVLRHHETC